VTLSKNEGVGRSAVSTTVPKEMKRADIYDGTLIEVNEILPSKVTESSLVLIYGNSNHVSLSSSSLKAKKEAVAALEKLCLDFSKKGSAYSILVSSAFTESDSYPDLESGYSFLLKAISDNDKVYSLDDGAVQIVHNFLEGNASEYGFIKRYTSENKHTTGIGESSVYRYVGIPHATFMTEHSLSLEEYLAYLKSLDGKHLFIRDNTTEYEIYYAPYATSLSVSKNEEVTVSGDNENGFIVTIERDTSPRDLGILLCLDAGHGGKDPGAVSGGVEEADIALSVIKLLEAECIKQGFSVLLTRSTDVFVELSDRCYIANRAKASSFISVHCNSATSVSANGTEVYYCYGANSTDLANKVYKQMINEMPLTERGVKQNNYVVIRDTEMPAILCELAFISNYSDRMKLTDPECQAKWAKAICKGICAYYGVSYLELD
jgi:N-acetylmuramoyl-L-alanine amidase